MHPPAQRARPKLLVQNKSGKSGPGGPGPEGAEGVASATTDSNAALRRCAGAMVLNMPPAQRTTAARRRNAFA
eukprot:6788330-Alexandrium_andersonii.AAC.1